MNRVIDELSAALATLGKPEPWSAEIKVTDEFLDPLFKNYFAAIRLPILLHKASDYELAQLMPADQIDTEVTEKLDAIVDVAKSAKPRAN